MRIARRKHSLRWLVGDDRGWVELERGLAPYDLGTLSNIRSSLNNGESIQLDVSELTAPLKPGKMIAIGLNYRDHASETGATLPESPLAFAKLTSSVIGPGDIIQIPTISDKIDFEAELAVVIGKQARNIAEAEALRYVFGYTIANDVTARDLQKRDGQWTRAKGMDTFCPLGPWVVTHDEVTDPQALSISLRLNGEVLQQSHTSKMVFSVAQIISHLSTWCTLCPGDLILTGTPAGVGYTRKPPVFLRRNDAVLVEIEHIGALNNTVQ